MKSPIVVAVVVCTSLLVASGVHCDGTTGDHRVRFGGTVIGSGPDGVTASGWILHFEQFVAAFGPVRIYSDEPFAIERRCDTRAPWNFRSRFSIGLAFAQHCHGCPRAPVAEFGFERGAAVDKAIDLLSPEPFQLGPANARNGLYRSVSFTFRSPVSVQNAGPVAAVLRGHSMVVRGTATRDGITIPFEGAIDLHTQDETAGVTPGERPYTTYGVMFDRPEGVFIDSTNEATDHVAIRVELARMFDQADFSLLPPSSTPGAPRVIAPDTSVYAAWRLGVENPRTFRVGWVGSGGCGAPGPLPPPARDAGR
uniref:Hypothetical conserved protein n=1 Tax=uncultured delta proteobacterium TaxID=34034 RepID=H5SLN0_9DELT|nr:hypothetical conserved protein [uncultured delta proteobacterium]